MAKVVEKVEFVSPNSTGFTIKTPKGTVKFTKRGSHSFYQTNDPDQIKYLTERVDAYLQGPFPVAE